ncbi:MAG: hypothetical protein AB7F28_00630 [Candidatus Margulisiibacteriota bacterium]
MKKYVWGMVLGLAWLATPLVVLALTMDFQGTAYNAANQALSGNISVAFKFYSFSTANSTYSAPSGAWTESKLVKFTNGNFGVKLGEVSPLVITDLDVTNPYLGITLPTSETIYMPVTSLPYAVKTNLADTAGRADAATVYGNFTTTVNVSKLFTVSRNILYVDPDNSHIGLWKTTPNQLLDVNGKVNVQGLYIAGQSFENLFPWQQDVSQNISYVRGNVGIGTATPRFSLDVVGTVNATALLVSNTGINLAFDWKTITGNTEDIYWGETSTTKIGIGRFSPLETLDINGGLRVGDTSSTNAGTIRWNGSDFQGYVSTSDGWVSLTGIKTVVFPKTTFPTQFVSTSLLTTSNLFYVDPTTQKMGIGTSVPSSRVEITGGPNAALFNSASSSANSVLFVGSTGNVGIGTITPNVTLQVSGTLDAKGITLGGKDLRLIISNATFWQLNPTGNSISYMLGNVGIGRPDPANLLQISQITNRPSQDPAISFSYYSGGTLERYTMGVLTGSNGSFRVEKGDKLGQGLPLFVAQQDRFGIGVYNPVANLTISGNAGVLFSGTYGVSANLPVTGPGTRFFFYPAKSTLVFGTLVTPSAFSGADWDDSHLSRYSVVGGFNNYVTGNFASSMGGTSNAVWGAYSTAFGGSDKTVQHDFSLALGKGATLTHLGAAYFGDSQPVASLDSKVENQLIIRSRGGVGIGTNTVSAGALTVAGITPTGSILRFVGNGGTHFSISTSGNVGIASDTAGSARLFVSGSVALGATASNASMYVFNNSTSNLYPTLMTVYGQYGVATPAMYISSFGSVGLGKVPGTSDAGALQLVSGDILADSYILPTGEELSTSPSVEPWDWETTTPNIYFPSGNIGNQPKAGFVGIGTVSPNSLLELSNLSNGSISPFLTFENYGTFQFGTGVWVSDPTALRFGPFASLALATPNTFVVKGSWAGINTASPNVPFDVRGTSIFSSLRIFSSSTNYTMAVSTVNMDKLYLEGRVISSTGTEWNATSNNRIYYDINVGPGVYSNIGIGTSVPQATLEVAGDVSSNGYVVQQLVYFSDATNNFTTQQLNIRENKVLGQESGDIAQLKLASGKLNLYGSAGVVNISEIFTAGLGNGGNLAFWLVSPNLSPIYLSETPFFSWDNLNQKWQITGNVNLASTYNVTSNYLIKNQINFDGSLPELGTLVSTTINNTGDFSRVPDHTAASINVFVDTWPSVWSPSTPTSPFNIHGLNIVLTRTNGSKLTQGAQAQGINVDVSNIQVQTAANPGYKYAGIFLGKVGIGLATPSAELDVKGIVSANNFVISNQLIMTTVNVQNALLVENGTVSIKASTGNSLLSIGGAAQFGEASIVNGFSGKTFSAKSNTFLVTSAGLVGVGNSSPVAQLDILKALSQSTSQDLKMSKLTQIINTDSLGYNTTGLDIQLLTATRNYVGPLNNSGQTTNLLNVDLSELYTTTGAVKVGIAVTMPPTNNVGSNNAAIFYGGNVGIGTTQPVPTAALQVVGTLYATNFPQAQFLSGIKTASFNTLIVTANMVLNTGNIQQMYVGTLNQNTLTVLSGINSGAITLNVNGTLLVNSTATFNGTANVSALSVQNSLSATNGLFTFLSVGGGTGSSGLNVAAGITSNEILATQSLTAGSFASHALTVGSGLVGIGEANPQGILDVEGTSGSYDAASPLSWSSVLVQNESAAADYASGIVLVPDTSNGSVGSGIAAWKQTSTPSSSSLVMISNPQGSTPSIQMILLASGNVGIGLTDPTVKLQVNRNATAITVNVGNGIALNRIGGTSGVSVSGSMVVLATANVSGDMKATTLKILQSNELKTVSNYGGFIVSGNYLKYNIGSSTYILNPSFSGVTGRVPIFGSQETLTTNAGLMWVTTNATTGKLVVSTVSSGNSVAFESYYPTSSTGTLVGQTVGLNFQNRNAVSGGSSTFFNGSTIAISGSTEIDGDTYVGLRVDLRNLTAVSGTQTFPQVLSIGRKVTGTFMGGGFGIGNSLPSGNVHITAVNPTYSVVQAYAVGSDGVTRNAMAINNVGYIGFGVSTNLSSQVTLKGLGADGDSLLALTDSTGLPLLNATDKVGLGTTSPQASLHVSGNQTLLLSTSPLFVTATGQVGVGTTQPQATLHVVTSNATLGTFVAGPSGEFVVTNNGWAAIRTTPVVGMGLVVSGDAGVGTFESAVIAETEDQNKILGYLSSVGDSLGFWGLMTPLPGTIARKAEYYFGGSTNTADSMVFSYGTTELLRMNASGQVSLAGAAPSATVTIQGTSATVPPLLALQSGTTSLVVSRNGFVGVSTANPTALLTVGGILTATKVVEHTQGTLLSASTVNVTSVSGPGEHFRVSRNISLAAEGLGGLIFTNPVIAASNKVMVSANISGSTLALGGLNLSMYDGTHDLNASAARAIGLYVDVTDVNTILPPSRIKPGDPNTAGKAYAASFLGNVVIGGPSSLPTADIPLSVFTMDREGGSGDDWINVQNFATMLKLTAPSTPSFSFAVRGVEPAAFNIGFRVLENNDEVGSTYSLYFSTGNVTTGVTENTAYVGTVGLNIAKGDFVNTSTKNTGTLLVAGAVQIGVTSNTTGATETSGRYGNKIFFSGGHPLLTKTNSYNRISAQNFDSDNGDDLFMGRYNASSGVSALRVNIGEDNLGGSTAPGSKFAVGYTTAGAWTEAFNVNVGGVPAVVPDGAPPAFTTVAGIGIGSPNQTMAPLHVYGNKHRISTALADVREGNLMVIENTSAATNANSLAIVFSNTGVTTRSSDSNFITFLSGTTSAALTQLGSVEGNSDGGVQFTSPEADYAEYLPKVDATEAIQKAEVVGIFGGKISRKTDGADTLMVISSTPIIAGNKPPAGQESNYGLVAFLGQVAIKVKGIVQPGDYLIPSGLNDGIAIAISPRAVTSSTVDKILGRAMMAQSGQGVHEVKAMVGFPHGAISVVEQGALVEALRDEAQSMRQANQKMELDYQKILDDRQQKIEQLRAQVQRLKRS